ncbi:MAG: hypothetical protein P1U57_14795, partial [Oleibacter sp.]|nr:hypothetical protein [Thalassolituus sp.]
ELGSINRYGNYVSQRAKGAVRSLGRTFYFFKLFFLSDLSLSPSYFLCLFSKYAKSCQPRRAWLAEAKAGDKCLINSPTNTLMNNQIYLRGSLLLNNA